MPVVTELVIDSAKAVSGAADYSRAMDAASSAAQRGLGAISDFATQAKNSITNLGSAAASMGPSLATMAVGVTAATVAFVAGFEAVKTFTAGLAEMGLAAKRANTDVETFQKLQFATGVGGLSSKDFASGSADAAEKLNSALRDTKKEQSEIAKLLDANNVKWKDGNKLILDGNGLINVARDLIFRASNEQNKIKMAEMLGLTKEWVPALDKSAQAFAGLQKEASALGLVISKETIAKAGEFDAEWRKSSLVFSTWMKSKLADLIPLLDELIAKAGEFKQSVISSLDAAAASPAGQEFTLRSNRAAAIMEMASVENSAKENADILAAAAKALAGTLSETTAKLIDQQLATKGLAKFWNDYAASLDGAAAAGEKLAKTTFSAANDNIKHSVLPDKEESKDALDRAIESIKLHTMVTLADKDAQGLGAAALAEFRTQAKLVEAAERASIDVTQKWQDKFDDLAADAGDAALALEKVKVATQIGRDRQLALLSPEDVQIANQLKGIYPDIATALNSSEAAGMRFNNTLKQAKDDATQFTQSLVKGLMDGKSVSDSLSSALKNLSARLADKAIEQLLSGDFEKAAISAISAAATYIGSLFTGNSAEKHKEVIKSIDYVSQLQARQIAATQDMASLAGQLAAFDHAANVERMNNDRDGGRERNQLELTLSEERNKIIADFGAQAVENEKTAAAARLAAQEEINKRIQSAQDRLFSATNDPTTLQGQLAAFDRQAQRDRQDEIAAGGQALVDLEAAQAAERYNVIKSFNDKITADAQATAKSVLDAQTKTAQQIVDYLNNLNVGSESSLSPQDRLAAAQTTFNATTALAAGGNVDAYARVTTDAENLRKAQQDFSASGPAYQATLALIKSTLANLPVVSGSTDPLVNAMLGVKTAVIATTTAVTTDTTQTSVRLDQSINRLDTTADRMATSIDLLRAIGQQQADIATGWYGRMVDYLAGIQNNTQKVATYFSQFQVLAATPTQHDSPTWWNPLTWFQQGGVVPNIRGAYAPGGIVGNGMFNTDSVLASFAGGGHIALAGGEGIINAMRTRQLGGQPAIDMLNRGMMPMAVPSFANDNARSSSFGSDTGIDYRPHFKGLAETNARGFSEMVRRLERIEEAITGGTQKTVEAMPKTPAARPGVKSKEAA